MELALHKRLSVGEVKRGEVVTRVSHEVTYDIRVEHPHAVFGRNIESIERLLSVEQVVLVERCRRGWTVDDGVDFKLVELISDGVVDVLRDSVTASLNHERLLVSLGLDRSSVGKERRADCTTVDSQALLGVDVRVQDVRQAVSIGEVSDRVGRGNREVNSLIESRDIESPVRDEFHELEILLSKLNDVV